MPMVVLEYKVSTPSGFVAPAGITHVQLFGWGGGGGGGAGDGGTAPGLLVAGGGGGGGAQKDVALIAVEPGTEYDVVVGAGGEGAPTMVDGVMIAGRHGGPGGDTMFVRKRDGSVLARFLGAGGGTTAFGGEKAEGGVHRLMCGGSPIARDVPPNHAYTSKGGSEPGPLPMGTGGYGNGLPHAQPARGSSSVQGHRGGERGAAQPYESIYGMPTLFGGGAGGGGAAGPGGDGARGGTGGLFGHWDSQGFGEEGWSADDNSGAGGGGGGSGGTLRPGQSQGIPPGTALVRPGNGGWGGSGYLALIYVT